MLWRPPKPHFWIPNDKHFYARGVGRGIARGAKLREVGAGVAAKVLTFKGVDADGSDVTVYTFSGVDIGTATSDRRVIVSASANNGTETVSSLTVGGVTADIIGQSQGGNLTTALCVAHVPTGTTADIVVTWTGAQLRCGIGWWIATGLSSNTPNDSGTSNAGPQSISITALEGGFIVAGCACLSATTVWSTPGTTNERYDQGMPVPDGIDHSGADESGTTAGASTVSSTNSADSRRCMVGAAW